jgi:hypothetical protein
MTAHFIELKQIFDLLSITPNTQNIELHSLPFIQPLSDIKITMRNCKIQRGFIQNNDCNPHQFSWDWSSAAWKSIADTVELIIDSQIPCHKYVSCYPRESAIVLISKGEYDTSNNKISCIVVNRTDNSDKIQLVI